MFTIYCIVLILATNVLAQMYDYSDSAESNERGEIEKTIGGLFYNLHDKPHNDDEDDAYKTLKNMVQMPRAAVMRCSRRFTPGECIEPVGSVWTYIFDRQNCTERLGCPLAERTNRFKSYNRCIRRCQPLSTVYTHVLAFEEGKHRLPLAKRRFHHRHHNDKATTFEPRDPDTDNEARPLSRDYVDEKIRQIYSGDDVTGDDVSGDEGLTTVDVDNFEADPELLMDFYNNMYV